jgi:hypothetical protein
MAEYHLMNAHFGIVGVMMQFSWDVLLNILNILHKKMIKFKWVSFWLRSLTSDPKRWLRKMDLVNLAFLNVGLQMRFWRCRWNITQDSEFKICMFHLGSGPSALF